MHKIYTTEGIVLTKRGVGEANSLVAILARELGLVYASAKSARRERSKLRYGLEPLTIARFSLLKGKHEWKVTGVERSERLPATSPALGRVAKLVLRLVRGEAPQRELFDTVTEGLRAFEQQNPQKKSLGGGVPSRRRRDGVTDFFSEDFAAADDALEIILVLRVLAHLGYLPHTPELAAYTRGTLFSPELVASAVRERAALIRTINASLQAADL